MKKILSILLVCLMVVPFGMLAGVSVSAADDDAVLYVKDNGAGDGSSADKALGTINDAYAAATKSGKNTTIVVVGDVHFDMQATFGFYPEKHAGKITITGKYGSSVGGRLLINAGDQQNWVLGGATEFKDITFATWKKDDLTKPNVVFRAHFNPITFGDGVVMADEGDEKINAYIVGGISYSKPVNHPEVNDTGLAIADKYNYDADTKTFTGDSTITVKSGTFVEIVSCVRLAFETNALVKGTSNIIVSGTANVQKICTFRSTGSAMSGDVNIYLDGGTVTNWVCHNHAQSISSVLGVTPESKFTVVITKNFNIANSFNNAGTDTFFQGIAGATLDTVIAAEALAKEEYGDYRLFAESSVFNDVVNSQKIFKDSFNTISKVDDATGLSVNEKTATPETSDTEMPAPFVPETEATKPVDSTPVDSDKQTDKETDKQTNKPATEKADSTTKAPETTNTSTAAAEEGEFPVWIIAVVAGVVVVAAVVVIIIVKKKKAE